MSDPDIAAVARHAKPVARHRPAMPVGAGPVAGKPPLPRLLRLRLERIVDVELLLAILLIGVPILVCCIVASTGR